MKPRLWATLRYFIRPYPWFFWGILVTTLLTSLLEGLHVASFFPLFTSLLKGEPAFPQGGFLGAMVRLSRSLPFHDPILSAISLLAGLTLIKNASMLLREGLVAVASGRIQHDVRTHLMECYARSPYLSLLEVKQGRLIYQTSVGASRVGIFVYKLAQWVAEGFKAIAIGLLLIVTLPLAAGILLVVGIGHQGLAHVLSRKISYYTGKERVIAGAEQTSIVNEFLNGIRQILVFGTSPAWLRRFCTVSQRFKNLYIQDTFWLAVPKSLLEFSVIGVLCGFILISRAVNPSALAENLGLIGLFAMAALKLLPSLSSLGQGRMELLSLMGDAEEVHRALTESRSTPPHGDRPFVSLQSGILFDSVEFSYPGREPIFKGLKVTFEKGKVTGIVGPSGSGKTTLVNLILGLFSPTDGRILIDGVPFNEYPLESWRRRIGFVAQDPFIFHASVLENITFGRNGHTLEHVQQAARIAHADEFIGKLPHGYETLVGERGMKLSTGQQQRIAIARAILENPAILIFDEATSALDTESERLVQAAMEKISVGRTVILIAHRLSTVRHADRIVVLDHGRVVEQGRHEELLNEQGRYAKLFS